MFKHAFDASTRVGWAVLFLCLMIMYLWEAGIHAVVEHDRQAREAKYRRHLEMIGLRPHFGVAAQGRR